MLSEAILKNECKIPEKLFAIKEQLIVVKEHVFEIKKQLVLVMEH